MKNEIELIKHLARTKLEYFLWMAFDWLHTHQDYQPSSALSVVADMLERCYTGEVKRLIINMPPHSLKSFSASIAFPAWVLARRPKTRITCYTASREIARNQHVLSTELLTHPGYRVLFPHVALASTNKQTIDLVHGGSRAAAVATTHSGMSRLSPDRGADIVIIDDPLAPVDSPYPARHTAVQRWFDHEVYQRLDDRADSIVIVVTQRFSTYDLTAHLPQRGEWTLLNMPAIATSGEVYRGKKIRERGEALCPSIVSRDQYLALLEDIGAMDFLAFYQQQPEMMGRRSEPLYHTWGYDPVLDLAVAKKQIFGIESEEFEKAKAEAEVQRRRDAIYSQVSPEVMNMTNDELIKHAEDLGWI